MGATFFDVIEALDAFAPPGLAEPWDNPGLQVGDPRAPLEAVLVALDPTPDAVAEARRRQAQLLVTHHPLLLKPLERVDLSTPPGRLIAQLLRSEIGLFCCHSNLDRAEGGVNDALARRLGLTEVEPFLPGEPLLKLVVTVPVGYEPPVRLALEAAGAGRIGRYEGCTFGARGVGTFAPTEGARPFLGRPGAREMVEETRLEAVVPRSRSGAARRAVAAAHPYEEAAIDLYPLESSLHQGGLGRVGRLPLPAALGAWVSEVTACLRAPGARYVGDADRVVERVAVIGGSGSGFWREAKAAGADVLLTGDLKYHTAQEAREEGFPLVDAGHGETEAVAVDLLAAALRNWSSRAGVALRVEEFLAPGPFQWIGG